MPLGEPFACKVQMSNLTIVLLSLVGGGIGYGVQKYAPKYATTAKYYNKLHPILQDLLPFASALAIGLPLLTANKIATSACRKGLKTQISQLQM